LKYGYLDLKTKYTSPPVPESIESIVSDFGSSMIDEIHLVVHIDQTSFIWICGSIHNSLFYFDLNYPDLVNDRKEALEIAASAIRSGIKYQVQNDRKLWKDKKHVGNDCKMLYNLPRGNHILSIGTNSSIPKSRSSVTHLIHWP
jgi:hypothetical protein